MHQRASTHHCRRIFIRHISIVGAIFRSQRVCNIESIVAVAGEHIRPYLSYLLGLTDLLGWIGLYVPSWVCEFYATL